MEGEPFTNRELKAMFDNVEKTLKEHGKAHSNILDQVKEGFREITQRQDVANGRTKTNELKIAYATGGLAVMSLIALPILAWSLYTLVNIDNVVNIAIEDELSTYQFEIVE